MRKQRLHRRQCWHGARGGLDVSEPGGLECQIARFDRDVLGEGAVPIPVREPEDDITQVPSRCPVTERGNGSTDLVAGITGVRSRPARSTQVEGHESSVGVKLAALTRTRTSPMPGSGTAADS